MAEVAATRFGACQTVTRFGETLVARNGDSDTKGELSVSLYEHSSGATALNEITYMRSLIGESPQEGDERLINLLAFDEVILMTGDTDGYVTMLEQYPDLPLDIREVVTTVPEVAETIDKIMHQEGSALVLASQPAEFFHALSQYEAHHVMQALVLGASDVPTANHELVDAAV